MASTAGSVRCTLADRCRRESGQINEHESTFTRELVRQGIANLGPGAIQVLLIDRAF